MPGNRFPEKNMAHQRLLTEPVTLTSGGNNQELIAAPGAGKRLRVFGVVVDNNGTAEADVVIRFGTAGTVVLDQTFSTGGKPFSLMLAPHFVQGNTNTNLQCDLNDQTTDDVKITVYYQVEDE